MFHLLAVFLSGILTLYSHYGSLQYKTHHIFFGERPPRDDARRDARRGARRVEATTRDAERIDETTRRRDRRAGEGDARAKATAMTTIEAKEIEALTIASMATRDAVRERRDAREKRERWRRMTRMRNQDV